MMDNELIVLSKILQELRFPMEYRRAAVHGYRMDSSLFAFFRVALKRRSGDPGWSLSKFQMVANVVTFLLAA